MDNSLDNPTAAESSTRARPNRAQETIIEQTSVIAQPSKESIPNETLSTKQSPSAPEWASIAISKIGIFDPDYPAPPNTKTPIRNAERHFVYKDVSAFCERLDTILSTMETKMVSNILQFLPNSFRNSASTWYYEELHDHERDLLMSEDTVKMWHEALKARFGGDGRRHAQSSVSITEVAGGRGRRRNLYSESVEYFEQRSGEKLHDWQQRIGKRN